MGLLEELAVRCEAATGADRDIDGWAFCSVNPDETTVIDHEPGRFPRKAIYGPVSVIMDKIGGKDGAEYLCAPAYTSSLDAAMSLLPEGVRLRGFGEGKSGYWTVDMVSRDAQLSCLAIGNAATPALALTAASLRARHALAIGKESSG